MSRPSNPPEVARETLKQLAARRLAPTPENFRRIYEEISGTATAEVPSPADDELFGQARELLAQALEIGVATHLQAAPELAQSAVELAAKVRSAADRAALGTLGVSLRKLWFRLEMHAEGDREVRDGVLRLLRLLIDSAAELVEDNQWLRGQVVTVQALVARPMNRQNLAQAESGLRDLVIKQANLKKSLVDAKNALRAMMARFLDRLAEMSETTNGYQLRIQAFSQQILRTDDVKRIGVILEDVARETREMHERAQRARDELLASRRDAEAAEQKVRELETELARVSEQVREDKLTGALTGAGLEEAYERESGRADRQTRPMCVALLEANNLNALAKAQGAAVADAARVHLAGAIRDALRADDVLARVNGDEFVILLPDADAEEAESVMERVQRNLTRRFFLHDNQRLLLTFSAVVAARRAGEPRDQLLERSRTALRSIRHAGRNRVLRVPDERPGDQHAV